MHVVACQTEHNLIVTAFSINLYFNKNNCDFIDSTTNVSYNTDIMWRIVGHCNISFVTNTGSNYSNFHHWYYTGRVG